MKGESSFSKLIFEIFVFFHIYVFIDMILLFAPEQGAIAGLPFCLHADLGGA